MEIINQYSIGDMHLFYIKEEGIGPAGFTIVPEKLSSKFTLDGNWTVESLIQLKKVGDAYPSGFSNGHTMRNSITCSSMNYREQFYTKKTGVYTIKTVLESDVLRGNHYIAYKEGSHFVTCWTEIENKGQTDEELEMLSSFSLCGLFSFESRERSKDFYMHRLRSKWSEEGRLETRSFLDMQLEPSWQRYGVQSIRYGQVGSMPVRRFFPWFLLEDKKYNCMLGGMMEAPCSWQIEIYSQDERPAVSGGIADREFGHWTKKLKPGEKIKTPKAVLTCGYGSIDEICARMLESQLENLEYIPESEKELPIIFNEFCTSWGKPNLKEIERISRKLAGEHIRYFVIDAGWYADPVKGWENNIGDWIPSKEFFPRGLKDAAELISSFGMIPGIWFEVENCAKDSQIYQKEEFLLKRDGYPLTAGTRRFLDFRKKEVCDYLNERVIGQLKKCGFGYIKVDYNETIGIGCDGEESQGENLREHLEEVQSFYRDMRRQIPELVMENCSSGGHRLEMSMMKLFSMASFSDAHECLSIPVIAANLHRVILPSQSQIWAVLRGDMNDKKIRYILASTFLGRMCLSGNPEELSAE